ncbi:MAG: hypothetical protein M1376_10820 [Planctomycetes bacterium]|nr:hypothetical protein [Planctomycetota bacterium]
MAKSVTGFHWNSTKLLREHGDLHEYCQDLESDLAVLTSNLLLATPTVASSDLSTATSDCTALRSNLKLASDDAVKGRSDLKVVSDRLLKATSDATLVSDKQLSDNAIFNKANSDLKVVSDRLVKDLSDSVLVSDKVVKSTSDLRAALSNFKVKFASDGWANVSDIKVSVSDLVTMLSNALV